MFFAQKPAYFARFSRGRSASPSRGRSKSPSRRRSRSRSPARDQIRSRSPARKSPARKSAAKMEPKTKDESPTKTTRSSPRKRTKMPAEPKVAKVEVVNVKAETPTRVTRSVTRKLVVEEKEALLSTEKEPSKNKSPKEYEFGGPVGATLMIFGLPVLVLAFYLYCNKSNLCSLASLKTKPRIRPLNQFFDLSCFMIYGAYLLFLALLYVLPIGKVSLYLCRFL